MKKKMTRFEKIIAVLWPVSHIGMIGYIALFSILLYRVFRKQ